MSVPPSPESAAATREQASRTVQDWLMEIDQKLVDGTPLTPEDTRLLDDLRTAFDFINSRQGTQAAVTATLSSGSEQTHATLASLGVLDAQSQEATPVPLADDEVDAAQRCADDLRVRLGSVYENLANNTPLYHAGHPLDAQQRPALLETLAVVRSAVENIEFAAKGAQLQEKDVGPRSEVMAQVVLAVQHAVALLVALRGGEGNAWGPGTVLDARGGVAAIELIGGAIEQLVALAVRLDPAVRDTLEPARAEARRARNKASDAKREELSRTGLREVTWTTTRRK